MGESAAERGDKGPPTWRRWWIYQNERFPILAHGLPIAAFSSAAVCFSQLLRGADGLPPLLTLGVAFGTAFLFFLQLRIADEFKDFEEDSRYRPYRPVPRGLVSLWELGWLGVCAALFQLALALALDPTLIVVLAIPWTYLVLMSKEFFVGDWLKRRPIIYMVSHMAIVPLVDFYATACDWWPVSNRVPKGLGWFLAASYCNGLVIELGRKIRGPADEEVGVNTYSYLWGPARAVGIWLTFLLATGICAVLAAAQVDFAGEAAVVLAAVLALACWSSWAFLAEPTTRRSKRLELLSGIWTIFMYLCVGTAPLLWHWWSQGSRGTG